MIDETLGIFDEKVIKTTLSSNEVSKYGLLRQTNIRHRVTVRANITHYIRINKESLSVRPQTLYLYQYSFIYSKLLTGRRTNCANGLESSDGVIATHNARVHNTLTPNTLYI